MKIEVQPGRYVVAVSGGVDSVALLDMLAKQAGVQLVVAHYDHGIREDSAEDRRFVQQLATRYDLPFVYDEGYLGKGASEAKAREVRYDFLRRVKMNSQAQAIITAHHQDDVIETALLNLLRGTGRKGLSSLRSTGDIVRPLLRVPKKELIAYAQRNTLQWHEDSTNEDIALKRNYVRHVLVPKLTLEQRKELLMHITEMHDLNHKIDQELITHLHIQPHRYKMGRAYFIQLPHEVAKEVLAMWLRLHGAADFDSKGLGRMTIAAKTYYPRQRIDVNNRYEIVAQGRYLALEPRDR